MSLEEEYESLDQEIKEILMNSKYRKATYFEPCTAKNINECLIGLHEQLGLLNMKYTYNPYTDTENGTLTQEAVVNLVNASWSLLQHYKKTSENSKSSAERVHTLEVNNQFLNKTVDRLKNDLEKQQIELKQCLAESRKIADRASEKIQEAVELKTKLRRTELQKVAKEHGLNVEIKKLKTQLNVLQDKYNGKIGMYVPANNNYVVERFKEKEKMYKETISKLQANNAELLKEVLLLKDELLCSSTNDLTVSYDT